MDEIARHLKLDPKKTSVAIQGFGNVGFSVTKHLYEHGYRIVALSDSKGAIYNSGGLVPEIVEECKLEKGMISECYYRGSVVNDSKSEVITNEELLELNVDVLVPAALENQINEHNAEQVKAKVVLEMANGPTTAAAGRVLDERGIRVVPDIIANAGGVIASYLEWLQNLEGKTFNDEEATKQMEAKIRTATQDMLAEAGRLKCDWRKAAYAIAVRRVVEAMNVR